MIKLKMLTFYSFHDKCDPEIIIHADRYQYHFKVQFKNETIIIMHMNFLWIESIVLLCFCVIGSWPFRLPKVTFFEKKSGLSLFNLTFSLWEEEVSNNFKGKCHLNPSEYTKGQFRNSNFQKNPKGTRT